MKPVKYETVKLKAQREAYVKNMDKAVCASLLQGVTDGTFDWRNNLDQLQEKVWEVIKQWDIRRVKTLHELFPSILPKGCKYVIDCTDRGWEIIE